ncbi:MAG: hypothetical protein CVU87_09040 [Firmicutes bacterium HGW-Firmicutes-12]|nr:MAG: hypothetical protein CVU87_09040 [Firmicutes bacterium HGW-Firmicutes-12]
MEFFKGLYSFNKIRQFSFLVEYVYIAFLCILIIKKYQPSEVSFSFYSPLVLNISVIFLYSIVLYFSERKVKPTIWELIVRFLYLYVATQLLFSTKNPSIQIIIVLPTVIMALRYSIKYTILMSLITTFVMCINAYIYKSFEIDYLIILTSFIWILGLLVNSSMVIERQMQEEKQKKQERDKLAAIGQLAAGIAHEVRNPLTTIKGFVQLLNKHGDKRNVEMTSCYLELIDKEIDRMNDLLKDFLLFAKPVKPKLAVTNINQTIKDIDTLLNNHCFNHSTKMELILNPEMPNIFCDYDQIKQVIINVVFNSIDAMKDCDRKIIRIMTKYKHDYIYINIEDTGVGMTEEQSRKIFDPFYTTKENGTGLGLSICYSIIENHQGKINVTSIINKGTIFEISLPRYN